MRCHLKIYFEHLLQHCKFLRGFWTKLNFQSKTITILCSPLHLQRAITDVSSRAFNGTTANALPDRQTCSMDLSHYSGNGDSPIWRQQLVNKHRNTSLISANSPSVSTHHILQPLHRKRPLDPTN